MMFLHKIGTKQVLIGSYDPYPLQCPNCKELDTINFLIHADYYHYWFIPIFPTDKDGYAICSNCDFRVNSIKYNKLTKNIYSQIKKKFRYPFYTYTGITLICAPFVLGTIALLFS